MRFKKITSLVIVVCLLMTMSMTAFAESVKDNFNSDFELGSITFRSESSNTFVSGAKNAPIVSTEDELATLSNDKLSKLYLDKLNITLDDEVNGITTKSTKWHHLSNFYIYKQLEQAFCVAATTQSILNYLSDKEYNQYSIAKDLNIHPQNGGYFGKIRPYVNAKQKKNIYLANDYKTPINKMRYYLRWGIKRFKAPSALRIVCSTSDGWPYNTNGHALCVSGARDDTLYFRIADPVIRYIDDNKHPFYTMSANQVHKAVTVNKYCGFIW